MALRKTMLEALVFTVCVNNYACDEALKAYYHEKPSIARKIKEVKKDVIFYTGDWVLYALPAAGFLTADIPATIKFTKELNLKANRDNLILTYTWDF